MNVLVVAAHPDDETLGCGGYSAKLIRQGHAVNWLILGEGTTSRAADRTQVGSAELRSQSEDCLRAASIIGVGSVTQLELPDNRFDSLDLLDVAKLIESEIGAREPAIVITHHRGDLNVDHRMTHEAVLTATRPVPGSTVHTVLAFEVQSATEWRFNRQDAFVPSVFVDISDTIDLKMSALEEYRSEMRQFPHPRSETAVRALATLRGSTVGVPAAEAFELVRAVR
ncbi:MAG: PIG-L deacetylase family protein [Microthrixaceae bacterium]